MGELIQNGFMEAKRNQNELTLLRENNDSKFFWFSSKFYGELT